MRSVHSLRLHRNQLGGRNEPQQSSLSTHYKKPLHRTRRVLRTRRSKWLIENGNIWNCNLSLPKQTNGRWQTADQRILNKPKNQPTCWPLVNKAQKTQQPPCHPIPVQARRQKLQLLRRAIGPLRSVHNHYSARDQAHHRSYPRANQRRIPRVPVCYPPTLNLQHTTKLKNSRSLKRNN